MSLVTGTPIGEMTTQEDLYLEGAPSIYFQSYAQTSLLFNPDSDGFYWGLTGSASYPVYEVGCPSDVSLTENLTINDVLCDNVGVKDTVQQRNYFELSFTIKSFFPLDVLRHFMKTGTVVETAPTQKMPLGKINNNISWHVYCPKVYDEDTGDYIWIHLHKCKFVDAITINMPFGNQWTMTGLKLRAFADTTKPALQQWGMWGRSDASVVV